MVNRQGTAYSVRRRLAWKLTISVAIASLAAGCMKLGKKDSPQRRIAAINYSKQAERAPLKPNNPLHIATAQWARKYEKNPGDANAALNYARSLKALGAKDKALTVLERSYQINRGNTELASDYGRLALGLGKTQLAEQLLNQAIRANGKKDWRVLSAMGTVNAKRGDHEKAQSYYMAALRQQPGATSVYNNLALSYALDGKAGDAEKLLREAVDKGHNTPVVRQNLALVLNLQSKFDEGRKVAMADLDTNNIKGNVTYMRNMVKATRTAQAESRRAPARTADPVTTAALPQNKRAKAAPKPMATASLPNRKPARPAAATAAQVKPDDAVKWEVNPNEVLPWQKKPAKAKRPTQVAGLSEKKADAPAKQSPATVPSWSVSVNEANAPARTANRGGSFRFPAPR